MCHPELCATDFNLKLWRLTRKLRRLILEPWRLTVEWNLGGFLGYLLQIAESGSASK
jgi:hypothetical protein